MRRSVILSLWILGALTGIFLLGIIIFILFLTITNYHPVPVEYLEVKGATGQSIINTDEFTLMTWNIGYAGLGKDMDFFYEGGKRVKPDQDEFRKYLDGILQTLRSNDTLDFILIQEADIDSKRSYHIDESEKLAGVLKDHSYAFAKNYDCRFVPVPYSEPMGKVVSGILSFLRFQPGSAARVDFGTSFAWPKRLVFLKRCFLVMRFRLKNGSDLVLINTHNSVFDEEGELRKKELKKLNDFMSEEFGKGNFVIAGGDWNQNPRGSDMKKIITGDRVKAIDLPFPAEIFSGWQFIFDPELPTNRDVDTSYGLGRIKTTIIDFFVVSPNVIAESVKTINTGFENADHQPVIMKIKIKECK
jgi:endonuclease/exonuclease/phosphatase family metal-dependent hydrolase